MFVEFLQIVGSAPRKLGTHTTKQSSEDLCPTCSRNPINIRPLLVLPNSLLTFPPSPPLEVIDLNKTSTMETTREQISTYIEQKKEENTLKE
jgi:hypothetical protein